jgi:hypothetical protein
MIVYEIRVKGHLDHHWSAWFNGLTISCEEDGSTLLPGLLPDEAALHGVLMKIRDLALPLLAVNQVATGESEEDDQSATAKEIASDANAVERRGGV